MHMANSLRWPCSSTLRPPRHRPRQQLRTTSLPQECQDSPCLHLQSIGMHDRHPWRLMKTPLQPHRRRTPRLRTKRGRQVCPGPAFPRRCPNERRDHFLSNRRRHQQRPFRPSIRSTPQPSRPRAFPSPGAHPRPSIERPETIQRSLKPSRPQRSRHLRRLLQRNCPLRACRDPACLLRPSSERHVDTATRCMPNRLPPFHRQKLRGPARWCPLGYRCPACRLTRSNETRGKPDGRTNCPPPQIHRLKRRWR